MDDKLRVKLEALITEREGMIAENQFCAQHDHIGVAYAYDSFIILAREMLALIEDEPEVK